MQNFVKLAEDAEAAAECNEISTPVSHDESGEFFADGLFRFRQHTFLVSPRLRISQQEAKAKLMTRIKGVMQRWNELRSLTVKSNETLKKTWMQKTRCQRKELLQEAWPEIPKNHPELEAIGGETIAQRLRNPEGGSWKHWLVPHVNVEDLSEDQTLLSFILSKVEHHPATYAMLERLPIKCAEKWVGVYFEDFLDGSIEFRSEIGHEMISITKPILSGEFPVNRMPVGQGLLVLKIQEWTLAFLVSCVKGLVSECSENGSSQSTVIADGLRFGEVTQGQPQLSVPSYHHPGNWCFENVNRLIRSRVETCAEHLRALQYDPEYLRQNMISQGEFMGLMGKDTLPLRLQSLDPKTWTQLVECVANTAVSSYYNWKSIALKLEELSAHLEADSSRANFDLFQQTILTIKAWQDICAGKLLLGLSQASCDQAIQKRIRVLQSHLATCDEDDYRNMNKPILERQLMLRAMIQQSLRRGDQKDELLAILLALCMAKRIDIPLLPFLDRFKILMDDIRQSSRIPQLATFFVKEITLANTVIEACYRVKPEWAHISTTDLDKVAGVRLGARMRLGILLQSCKIIHRMYTTATFAPGFPYPENDPATKEEVDVRRQTELDQRNLWKDIMYNLKISDEEGAIKVLREVRPSRRKRRTLPFRDPAVITALIPNTIFPVEKPRRPGKMDKPEREKIKTRPATAIEKEESDDEDNFDKDVQPPMVWYLENKHLEVFRELFHDPDEEASAKGIGWKSFLDAMQAAQFSGSTRSSGGSSWVFKTSIESLARISPTVTFHQPHDRWVTHDQARLMGSRLRKTYGMSSKWFRPKPS